MRPLFVSLFAALVTSLAPAAPLDVVRVWPGYRTADSFERISELFTNRENPGRETILRTQATIRNGYYFLVRLKNPAEVVPDATFELKVLTPTSPEPRTFSFQSPVPRGSHAFDLGLTGADWPDATAHPVAWLLTVRSPDGATIAQQQSFLWALPEPEKPAPAK